MSQTHKEWYSSNIPELQKDALKHVEKYGDEAMSLMPSFLSSDATMSRTENGFKLLDIMLGWGKDKLSLPETQSWLKSNLCFTGAGNFPGAFSEEKNKKAFYDKLAQILVASKMSIEDVKNSVKPQLPDHSKALLAEVDKFLVPAYKQHKTIDDAKQTLEKNRTATGSYAEATTGKQKPEQPHTH